MSQFNYFGSGAPSGVPSPAATIADYLDTQNNSLYFSTGSGWVPNTGIVAKAVSLAQTANKANVLTYTAPVSGLYRISTYAVSSNTPGVGANAAVPGTTAAYTDADTNGSITETVIAATASTVAAANIVNQGTGVVNAKAGTNIVLATTGYVAGGGTALQYNVKVRIQYLG